MRKLPNPPLHSASTELLSLLLRPLLLLPLLLVPPADDHGSGSLPPSTKIDRRSTIPQLELASTEHCAIWHRQLLDAGEIREPRDHLPLAPGTWEHRMPVRGTSKIVYYAIILSRYAKVYLLYSLSIDQE